ncbi:unnamed protein product [Urochloa decumbens]|uniref:RING-type E3 ubiquitin transferase n=1 Tax=Urochloa decumbens TaxID=240449 RepID=A0ABC9DYX7_9POAL
MPIPSAGDIVVCAWYVLMGAVMLVLMIRAIFVDDDQPPAAAEGGGPRLTLPEVGPPGALAPYPRAMAPAPAPVPAAVALPYFPYASAARGGPPSSGGGQASSETTTVVCAICLDQLRRGQPCSEVPACRHTFHRDCVGAWARSSNTCPLCRVEIIVVPRCDAAHGIGMV